MKLMRQQKVFALLFIVLITLVGCKKDDNPTESNGTPGSFVGTWKLTKITVNVSGASLDLTPEQAGTQATIVAGSNGSYQATTTTSAGTTSYTGTYKINGTKIEIKYSDGTTEAVEFTVNSAGNKLTIKRDIEAFGAMVPATLEFTKQ